MEAQALLEGLDDAQRRAVTSPTNPLCILAGAGSGKTRVLTRRIAHRALTGDADPRRVLALTFTRRAAAELSSRLRSFGLRDLPAAGTFHATAYAQLRDRWSSGDGRERTLLESKGRILNRLLSGSRRAGPADLAAEIEWAKARLVRPADYPHAARRAGRSPKLGFERIADLYERYEAEKHKKGLVDFDDLLALCAEAIETDPTFAAAQRWRFRHLFVDEYQDVNPLQERVLRAWLGDRTDLCVVGDPNQAIYAWNGADASHLLQFTRRHPGAEVVELVDSYRSTPQILHVAATVLAGDRGSPRPLRAHRSSGAVPEVVGYATDADEANGIARALRDHHGPGTPWSAQAVLVRTNAQTALIEASLRRARIPHRVRGATGFLDEPEVRELLGAFARLNEPFTTTLVDLDATVARRRRQLTGEDGDLHAAADEIPDLDSVAARRLAALETMVRLGHEFLAIDKHAPTNAFPTWLTATIRNEEPERAGDAVSIVSFHAAKGLEWPVVHVAGLEQGFVPITHAREPEALEEERRLLYVAVTRARTVLRGTWAQQRTFGGQTYQRKPSPYLRSLMGATADLAGRDAPAPAVPDHVKATRASLAASRALDAPSGTDPALLAALRTWRDGVARVGRVAPTVVLSDRTLSAVAATRPTTTDALTALPGIGPVAVGRYGAMLLALVAEHAQGAEPTGQAGHAPQAQPSLLPDDAEEGPCASSSPTATPRR
ncbi:MAG: ATP-dependent helicase [Acidimicrobiales bacterium]|nr:ATP-dependent helicase [Acidimicrobiales bacterium]